MQAAILTSDDENMDSIILPHGSSIIAMGWPCDGTQHEANLVAGDLRWLMRNWYSAALFCLEIANYMRDCDLMHVQAIGLLQMCSNAVGDIIYRNRIMTIGVQIANDLGIPFQAGSEHSLIQSEISWRLW